MGKRLLIIVAAQAWGFMQSLAKTQVCRIFSAAFNEGLVLSTKAGVDPATHAGLYWPIALPRAG